MKKFMRQLRYLLVLMLGFGVVQLGAMNPAGELAALEARHADELLNPSVEEEGPKWNLLRKQAEERAALKKRIGQPPLEGAGVETRTVSHEEASVVKPGEAKSVKVVLEEAESAYKQAWEDFKVEETNVAQKVEAVGQKRKALAMMIKNEQVISKESIEKALTEVSDAEKNLEDAIRVESEANIKAGMRAKELTIAQCKHDLGFTPISDFKKEFLKSQIECAENEKLFKGLTIEFKLKRLNQQKGRLEKSITSLQESRNLLLKKATNKNEIDQLFDKRIADQEANKKIVEAQVTKVNIEDIMIDLKKFVTDPVTIIKALTLGVAIAFTVMMSKIKFVPPGAGVGNAKATE